MHSDMYQWRYSWLKLALTFYLIKQIKPVMCMMYALLLDASIVLTLTLFF